MRITTIPRIAAIAFGGTSNGDTESLFELPPPPSVRKANISMAAMTRVAIGLPSTPRRSGNADEACLLLDEGALLVGRYVRGAGYC
jgi:hypothetical protein